MDGMSRASRRGGRGDATKVKLTMVKRRKVLIGAGALFAGSSAAIGTGAVTNSKSERGLTGRVADDRNAYIALKPNDGGAGHHAQFVQYDSKGELTLDFDAVSGDGNGLNPDSVMSFRSAFTIENQNRSGNNEQIYKVWIDSPSSRLNFFTNIGSITGESNFVVLDQDGDANAGPGRTFTDSIPVGVEVDLRDSGLGRGDSINQLFDSDDEFEINLEFTLDSSL